jgi:hypothetical protein
MPFMLRQSAHPRSESGRPVRTLGDFVTMPEFASAYAEFSRGTSPEVASSDDISMRRAAAAVDRAFSGYTQVYLAPERRAFLPWKIRRFDHQLPEPTRILKWRKKLIEITKRNSSSGETRSKNTTTRDLLKKETSPAIPRASILQHALELVQRYPEGIRD